MTEPNTYEIVIRGRAEARLLRPLLDDFTFDHTGEGVTRLTGEIRDASHLHGVMAHLTSMNVELVSITPVTLTNRQSTTTTIHHTTRHERNETS